MRNETWLGRKPLFMLVAAIIIFVTGNVHAQWGGGGDNYYIPDYYLYLPPPPIVRREVVRQVITEGGTNRIARGFRKISKVAKVSRTFRGSVFKPRARAGGWLTDTSLSIDLSRAEVDDDLLAGKGDDTEVGLMYFGTLADDLALAFGVSQDRYDISGVGSYLQYTDSFDILLTYYLSDNLTIGGFINHSRVDIEKSPRWDTNTFSWVDVADSFERYGVGITLTYDVFLGDSTNLGICNTVASMNKHTFADIGDNEDSAWLLMFDLDHAFSDAFSVNTFLTLHHLLDGNDSVADGSYGMLGFDVSYRLGKSWVVSAGYETTAKDNDGNEQRLNLSTVLEF